MPIPAEDRARLSLPGRHRCAAVLLWMVVAFLAPAAAADEGVVFVGEASSPDALDAEASAAWRFARDRLSARYVAWERLDEEALSRARVLWWHHTRPEIPAPAQQPQVLAGVLRFVDGGGGVLLSGFGTRYAARLGLAPDPTQVRNVPTISGAWGFTRKAEHPIFDGLPERFLTVSDGMRIRGLLCWWVDAGDFPGRWLADVEGGRGLVAIGELERGRGRVVVVGAGAFAWDTGGGVNLHGHALRRLTHNAVSYLGATGLPELERVPVSRVAPPFGVWALDRQDGPVAAAEGAAQADRIADYVASPAWRSGVSGEALDFNGYSTYVIGPSLTEAARTDEVSVQAWVAVREYPTAFAAVAAQRTAGAGFGLGLDRHGRPVAAVGREGVVRKLSGDAALPLGAWVHLALSVDAQGAKLYVNGDSVAACKDCAGPVDLPAHTPLMIGRDPESPFVADMFAQGVFNGLIDDVRVEPRAAPRIALRRAMRSRPKAPPDLSVADRFFSDALRPRYHPMPDVAWTNEPHGLIFFGGRYHLTYQANPSGPYWQFLRWGRLSSQDLVRWRQEPIAMRPGRGAFDLHGVWSGAALEHAGKLWLFYTGVDGVKAAIGAATSVDGEAYTKHPENPLIPGRPDGPFRDFRDPIVWRDAADGVFRMLVGGGTEDQRGVLHGYRSEDLIDWQPTGVAFEGSGQDAGRYWEMPIVLDAPGDRTLLAVNTLPQDHVYWVGRWRNDRFVPLDPSPASTDLIVGVLSPTVTRDVDGHYVGIGVMPEMRDSGAQLAAGWAHCFSLPRRWKIDDAGRLHQSPHPSLRSLRGEPIRVAGRDLLPGAAVEVSPEFGSACEVELVVELDQASRIELSVLRSEGGAEETVIVYDATQPEVALDRSRSSLVNRFLHDTGRSVLRGSVKMPSEDGSMTLRVFVDRSALSVFLNDREAFGARAYPSRADARGVRVSSHGGPAKLRSLTIWPMGGREGGG